MVDSPPRIYLADPDAAVVRFLRGTLEAKGHRVQEAADWSAVPDEARACGADLILLSTESPGIYYGDVIRQVKGDPRTRDLPLLVLVPATDPRSIRGALEEGADDIVVKPVVAADLLNKLRIHTVRSRPAPVPSATSPVSPASPAKGPPAPDDPRFLGAIADVAEGVASSLTPEDAFFVLARRLAAVVPCDRCAVAMTGSAADEIVLVAAHDEPDLRHQRLDAARHRGWREAMERGEPDLPDPGPGAEWVLPLVVRERAVGALVLRGPRPAAGQVGPSRLLARVMAHLAATVVQASDALENVKFRSVEGKAPAEHFDNIVLDLNDQIEVLIEEMESE